MLANLKYLYLLDTMTVSTDPSAKEMLTAMAESSSIHGVSRWVTSKHWYQRGLWLIVFLGATCGASYQLWRLFESYTSYPVKTSVELDFSQLQFPAVSFCNMNPIKASQLSKTSNKAQESLQVTVSNSPMFYFQTLFLISIRNSKTN